ncbi:MAG: arginyltransferase [Gammaproteobacteria bacterium]|nr:MAG: arginyltransferase [Gammaproteobacteria bacterium]
MSGLHSLVFYATPEHDCGYLPEKKATTLFVDPSASIDNETYTQLTRAGFRRSGNYYYKPICTDCIACIPARIPCANYSLSKSNKRLVKKHKETHTIVRQPEFREEHYRLYEQYINQKHRDGDMYPPSREQYQSFIIETPKSTQFIEFWQNGCLISVAVIDQLQDGISAIYTFYDPDYDRISPGKYAILWQIAYTQQLNKPYLYLGYWIKNCRKMSYKTDFRPIELLVKDRWTRI